MEDETIVKIKGKYEEKASASFKAMLTVIQKE